jgi:GGDEF domain-containing protein
MAGALLQLSNMLMRALRLHAVRGDEHDLHRFQASILQLEQRIGETPNPKDVLIVAGEAAKAFEDYSYQTTRFLNVQSAELTKMISMLTSTITSISDSSQVAVSQLTRVEKRIENIAGSSDLPAIKAELADCLAMVREEAIRQREQTQAIIHSLQRSVSDSRQVLAEAGKTADSRKREPLFRDPVTGLPSRADAEDAITQARRNANQYVAILPIDRYSLIQSRFGADSADRVASFTATHCSQHLQPGDRLFRWNTNAFVLLVERSTPADTVRSEIHRWASLKLELTLEHHGRELLLPISSSWVSFPASEGRSRDALVEKIDAFLNNHVHAKESFS